MSRLSCFNVTLFPVSHPLLRPHPRSAFLLCCVQSLLLRHPEDTEDTLFSSALYDGLYLRP